MTTQFSKRSSNAESCLKTRTSSVSKWDRRRTLSSLMLRSMPTFRQTGITRHLQRRSTIYSKWMIPQLAAWKINKISSAANSMSARQCRNKLKIKVERTITRRSDWTKTTWNQGKRLLMFVGKLCKSNIRRFGMNKKTWKNNINCFTWSDNRRKTMHIFLSHRICIKLITNHFS